ncbi:MAG: hypothetical protein ACMUHX_04755 [bacterium]
MAKKIYSGGSPKMSKLNASREKDLQDGYRKGESRATKGQRPDSRQIKTASYRDSLRFLPGKTQSHKKALGYLPPKTESFIRSMMGIDTPY